MPTPPTEPARPVPLPLTAWRRDLEDARRIVDPVVRARALEALCAAQIAAVEEIAARVGEAANATP